MTMPISQKRKDGGHVAGPQNVPSVIEIQWTTNLPNGKVARNTVHGFYSAPPANMQTLANGLSSAIISAWNTNLASLMPTTTSYGITQIRDMTNFTNPVFIAVGTAQPGTSVSPAMPVNNAIVMTEQIAARGKGMKGRVYLAGFATNADSGGGVISSAAQTGVNNFGTALMAALQGQSLQPCVAQVHRQQYQGITGTVHPDRPAGHVNVTGYVCMNTIWDTQRRRIQL